MLLPPSPALFGSWMSGKIWDQFVVLIPYHSNDDTVLYDFHGVVLSLKLVVVSRLPCTYYPLVQQEANVSVSHVPAIVSPVISLTSSTSILPSSP